VENAHTDKNTDNTDTFHRLKPARHQSRHGLSASPAVALRGYR
jgi:hypothetical protein